MMLSVFGLIGLTLKALNREFGESKRVFVVSYVTRKITDLVNLEQLA